MSSPQKSERPQKTTTPLINLPRLLFNRRWWWTTLLVIVGMLVLARLGIWQLNRLDQRKTPNAELVRQLEAVPLSLNKEFPEKELLSFKDRHAQVRGQFDYSQEIILTQQSLKGIPGVHLITPFLIEDLEKAVLVDRGWVPVEDSNEDSLAQFHGNAEQDVSGTIQLSQTLSRGRKTETNGPLREWYRVEIEAIEKQMPYELLPIYLVQSPNEGEQELPYRNVPEIDLSNGPHLAYAIQWFLFTALLGGGYLRFVSLNSKKN